MNDQPYNLAGKTAIVTGGSSGIGLAISQLFATRGAGVYIIDIDEGEGKKACEQILQAGGQATFIKCDVSAQAEVQKAIDAIDQDEISILVNNAGVAHIGNIEQTSEQDLDRIYDINIKGVFNCTRAVIPRMKNSGGVILNLASIASVVGLSDRFAYSMSKGAVLTMTYSVAKDYIQYGIRCNSIAPARVHTPFVDGFLQKNYPGQEAEMFDRLSKTQPIGRMGTPREVAHLALYLCSDEASFITGSCYPIDGGFITLNS